MYHPDLKDLLIMKREACIILSSDESNCLNPLPHDESDRPWPVIF